MNGANNMKKRSGFVSNSSSSSFVVVVFDYYGKRVLSPEKEAILKEYGFAKVKTFSPLALEMGPQPPKLGNAKEYNYAYSVTVNQCDIICFLLKHNISFEGSCHYGHQTVVYRDQDKYFLRIPNYGLEYSCYYAKGGLDTAMEEFKLIDREPKSYDDVFVKVNVKDYLDSMNNYVDEEALQEDEVILPKENDES